MGMAFEDFLDDVADVTVAHVRLAEGFLADPGQLAHRVADDGVSEIQLALIPVGEGPRREKDRRQGQRLIVEAGEVFAEHRRLFQLAAGGADRLARPGQCLHGPSLCKRFPSFACGGEGGGCQPCWIWSGGGAVMVSPLLYLSKVS